jgi:hypothetical protein
VIVFLLQIALAMAVELAESRARVSARAQGACMKLVRGSRIKVVMILFPSTLICLYADVNGKRILLGNEKHVGLCY